MRSVTASRQKADAARNKELVQLCSVARQLETLMIGESLQTRPFPSREFEEPTSEKVGFLVRRIIPSAKAGPAEDVKVFDIERHVGIDVKVPSTANPGDETHISRHVAAENQ